MGGHRIARGDEYQLIGLIVLLLLVFDTAALRKNAHQDRVRSFLNANN